MTTKICKKHGELKSEQTYRQFIKKTGNWCVLCSICKQGYRNDWARINPEKVKISQEKKRLLRLKELENGSLKKTCKRHGELSIEKIKVDSRGTRVCRLCDVENKRELIKRDPEKFRKRVAEWFHGDPERKQRYRKNDYEKRRIRQKRLYEKWKENPEWREKYLSQSRSSDKKARELLLDSYVESQIRCIKIVRNKKKNYRYITKDDLPEIPKEIIELKRVNILIHREIRRQKHEINQEETSENNQYRTIEK